VKIYYIVPMGIVPLGFNPVNRTPSKGKILEVVNPIKLLRRSCESKEALERSRLVL
jgi:hypothetical protein